MKVSKDSVPVTVINKTFEISVGVISLKTVSSGSTSHVPTYPSRIRSLLALWMIYGFL